MNSYRYPKSTLVADYLRAAAGVLLPSALMIFTELLPLFFYSMGALVLLFAIYGLRTAQRQGTVLIVDGDGIRQEGPLGGMFDRKMRWSEMGEFRLRYYSTRRDGKEGWMQLLLRGAGNGGAIRMDSNLPGFNDIVAMVYAAAQRNGLTTDPASAANLAHLGLGTDDTADNGAGGKAAGGTPNDPDAPTDAKFPP